jgi:hypothetical protein
VTLISSPVLWKTLNLQSGELFQKQRVLLCITIYFLGIKPTYLLLFFWFYQILRDREYLPERGSYAKLEIPANLLTLISSPVLWKTLN